MKKHTKSSCGAKIAAIRVVRVEIVRSPRNNDTGTIVQLKGEEMPIAMPLRRGKVRLMKLKEKRKEKRIVVKFRKTNVVLYLKGNLR